MDYMHFISKKNPKNQEILKKPLRKQNQNKPINSSDTFQSLISVI